VILLLYLFISYIIIYWVYLNVKLINLKTKLFINEIDRDFDGFLSYKSNFIKSNRYLQGQVWATKFTVDYQQYMLEKRGIQVRTPVTISAEKVKAFASLWQKHVNTKNIVTGTAILGGAASLYQAIAVSDHISRPGQGFDLKRYGYYHPRTEIFEYFRALESGGFIRPEDRHMFIDDNGLLKAGHVRESYLDLIGDGSKPSKNVEFQEWKKQRMLEQKTYRGSLTPPDVLPRITPATASARDAIGGIPSLNEVATESKGIRPFTPAEAIRGVKKV
jgi:hypothetical protein